MFTVCEQSQLWKSWYFWSKKKRNLQEKLGLLTPLGVQLRVLPTNALPVCQFCLHVDAWGECCPLEPCGRVRHLWDAAKICMLDLPGHGPWGTCTEALPHSWKIRLYCDFPATSIINCTFPRHMPRWHGMISTVSIQKWSCACGCRLSWSCLSHCCITLTPSHAALGYDLDWPCKMNVVTCYDMWCPRVSFNSQPLWMRHKSTLRNSTSFSFIHQLPILQLPFLQRGIQHKVVVQTIPRSSSHGAAHWFVMWRGTAPTPVGANELGQRHHTGREFCSWLMKVRNQVFPCQSKAWRWLNNIDMLKRSQTSDSKRNTQTPHRPRWFGRTCAAETGPDFGARDDWFRSSTTLQIKRGWVGLEMV